MVWYVTIGRRPTKQDRSKYQWPRHWNAKSCIRFKSLRSGQYTHLEPVTKSPLSNAAILQIDWHGIMIVCSHLPSKNQFYDCKLYHIKQPYYQTLNSGKNFVSETVSEKTTPTHMSFDAWQLKKNWTNLCKNFNTWFEICKFLQISWNSRKILQKSRKPGAKSHGRIDFYILLTLFQLGLLSV